MEQRKTESINQFVGRWNSNLNDYKHCILVGMIGGRWKRGFFRVCTLMSDSMRHLYMKEDVGYEEFLATVYEAETEGSEGKVLNMKAKAMTVENIMENK